MRRAHVAFMLGRHGDDEMEMESMDYERGSDEQIYPYKLPRITSIL